MRWNLIVWVLSVLVLQTAYAQNYQRRNSNGYQLYGGRIRPVYQRREAADRQFAMMDYSQFMYKGKYTTTTMAPPCPSPISPPTPMTPPTTPTVRILPQEIQVVRNHLQDDDEERFVLDEDNAKLVWQARQQADQLQATGEKEDFGSVGYARRRRGGNRSRRRRRQQRRKRRRMMRRQRRRNRRRGRGKRRGKGRGKGRVQGREFASHYSSGVGGFTQHGIRLSPH